MSCWAPKAVRFSILTDRYPATSEDLAWMRALGDESGWVVISADRRIHRNRLEREAWRRSGLVGQFLPRTVPDEIRSRPVI
jgi:hypothetical protein